MAANQPVGITWSRSFRVSHGLWGSCSGCTGRRRENRDEASTHCDRHTIARPSPKLHRRLAVTCEIVEHVVQKLPGSVWFLVQIEDVLGQRVSCRKEQHLKSVFKNPLQNRPQRHISRFVEDKRT